MPCPFCAKQELSFSYSGSLDDESLSHLPGKSISVTYGNMDRIKQHPESEIRECESCHTLWTLSYDYPDHPPVVITGNVIGHDLKSTYNRIARDYYEDHKNDTWGAKSIEHFLRALPPHAKILDLGCGNGLRSKLFKEHGHEVVGIDLSEGMIEIAKEISPEIRFEVRDMRDMKNFDSDLDAIHSQASLLHLKKSETEKVIQELTEHLKIGGLFFIAVKGVRPNGAEEETRKEDDYGYDYERFWSYYTPEDLRSYFKKSGLEEIAFETEPSGRTTWHTIIGRKTIPRNDS